MNTTKQTMPAEAQSVFTDTGDWLPIDLHDDEPRGGVEDSVLVVFEWGAVGFLTAHEVRALKRAALFFEQFHELAMAALTRSTKGH